MSSEECKLCHNYLALECMCLIAMSLCVNLESVLKYSETAVKKAKQKDIYVFCFIGGGVTLICFRLFIME